MTTWILLILIGLAAGLLSGFLGIGGGLILVPALMFILGYSQHQAQGTSLGMLLLPVGILGVYQYWKEGMINLKAVALLAIGFVVGAHFGSLLAIRLSPMALKRAFAVFLIFVAIKYLKDTF